MPKNENLKPLQDLVNKAAQEDPFTHAIIAARDSLTTEEKIEIARDIEANILSEEEIIKKIINLIERRNTKNQGH